MKAKNLTDAYLALQQAYCSFDAVCRANQDEVGDCHGCPFFYEYDPENGEGCIKEITERVLQDFEKLELNIVDPYDTKTKKAGSEE